MDYLKEKMMDVGRQTPHQEWDEMYLEIKHKRDQAYKSLLANPSVEAAEQFMVRFSSSTERPYDVLALLPLMFPMASDSGAWQWVAQHWSLFDLIPHSRFQKVFSHYRKGWTPEFMDLDDRKIYEALPTRFEVFRGQNAGKAPGISWTLDREVATKFAEGHRGIWNKNPVILSTTVLKRSVAMILVGRSEAEVVMFTPPRRFEVASISSRFDAQK